MRHKILNFSLVIAGTLAIGLIFTIVMILIFDSPVKISYAKPMPAVAGVSAQAYFIDAIWNVTYPDYKISSLPIRLKIPKIKIDAIVENVGLTPQGAVGVPKKPQNVAWYDLGPRPGDIGSAVITGHYGPWKNGAKSVFNNLNKLRVGDKVYIENDQGEIITFVVRKIKSFDEKASVPELFGINDGRAHLNIVTCEGIWNTKTKSYSARLIIFADKE